MLWQHGCSGTLWEVAFSALRCLTGETGSGGVEVGLGAGEVSGGQEVADPEDKRLKNAWEALWVGVTFAAGSAVSFGAAGVYGQGVQGSPDAGTWQQLLSSPVCAELWVQVGNGVASVRTGKLVCCFPSACRHLSFLGADSSSVPWVECNASAPSLLPAALGCFAKSSSRGI